MDRCFEIEENKDVQVSCDFFKFFVSNYLDSFAEEVNDKLQEQGQVTIAELTKAYDLPADFLSEVNMGFVLALEIIEDCIEGCINENIHGLKQFLLADCDIFTII